MNPALFRRIAKELLKQHYGICLNDTALGYDTVVKDRVRDKVRPFEAVNEHAQACDLDRIDRQGYYGVPSKDPLTMQDELAILARVRPVTLLDEQPTCCGYCGTRTEFDVLDDGRQHHCCLNDWCGNEFIAEDEEAACPA